MIWPSQNRGRGAGQWEVGLWEKNRGPAAAVRLGDDASRW